MKTGVWYYLNLNLAARQEKIALKDALADDVKNMALSKPSRTATLPDTWSAPPNTPLTFSASYGLSPKSSRPEQVANASVHGLKLSP